MATVQETIGTPQAGDGCVRSVSEAGLSPFGDYDVGLGATGLDVASTVPGPQQGIVAGVDTVLHAVGGVFNLGGGGAAVDQARAARAASYLIGVENGDVMSGQLMLGALQSQTAKAEHQLYLNTVQAATNARPDVMQQAYALGATHDTEDGQLGLAELVKLQIPFNMPHMGGSTAFNGGGNPLSSTTRSLVQQLLTLAAKPGAQLGVPYKAPGTPTSTATATAAGGTAPAGTVASGVAASGLTGKAALIGALAIGGAWLAMRKRS